jgi:hypothetical protein
MTTNPKTNWYSYFPLMYLYVSRLKNPVKILQLIGGDFVFVFLLTIGFSYNVNMLSLSFSGSAVMFLLSKAAFCFFIFITFFTLYEIGYVVNDCVIAKRENSPTLRFENVDDWKKIVLSKVVGFAVLTVILSVLFKVDVSRFIIFSVFVVSFFLLLHNTARIEDRGGSYFWLEYLRLLVIPFVLVSNSYIFLILSVAILPEVLRRTIRYIQLRLKSDKNRRFNLSDLRIFLMSSFFVFFVFFSISFIYLLLLIIPYSIVIAGILFSVVAKE